MEEFEEITGYLMGLDMSAGSTLLKNNASFVHKEKRIGVDINKKKGEVDGFVVLEDGERDYGNLTNEVIVAVDACKKIIAGDEPEPESEQEAEAVDAELVNPGNVENTNGVNKMKESTAVTTQESTLPIIDGCGIVRPMVSALQAKEVWDEFQALKRAIIEPSDMQNIQGKSFVKKSGWRKLANAFNLSDEILEEVREEFNDGKEWIWTIKVRAIAPNGRACVGVAKCTSSEKTGTRKEHDTYTTAHTRAKNRAISDLIAAGEVSAEEMK